MQPADLAKLLNALTDQLLLQGRVDAAIAAAPGSTPPGSTPPTTPPMSNLWVRLLEGTRRSMIGFGCKVKLQIDTGLLTAELRECAGQ